MSERAEASAADFWADADPGEALQRYRTLVNAIDDGIYQLDADGRFVAVNDVIVELSGYSRERLLGERVSLLLDAADVATIQREIARRLATDGEGERNRDGEESDEERTDTFEFAVTTADGDRIACELRLNLLVEDGAFRGTIGVVRDVSDRRRAERELGERERQLERERDLTDEVLEASPVGVMVLDDTGAVTRTNERARTILGISEAERGTYSPDDRPAYDEDGRPLPVDERPFARVLETGEPVYDRVLQVERSDGERRWLSVSAAPIRDDDGEIDGVVTTGEDVTDIKRRERELEGELNEVFGRVTDAFYALDADWRFTHVNDRAEELIDYRDEGLIGESFWEVFEWAEGSKLGDEYRTAMETQEPTSFEFYYPEPLEAWYEIHAYPSETGLSVYFQDVTERTEYERQLAENERKYRTLAEYFPNGIVTLFDHDLRYTLAAGQGFEDIPVDPEEVEGRSFREVWDEETVDALEPVFDAALDGDQRSVELEYEGREWVVHGVPITDERGEVFAGMTMAQDISEQKERERYLHDAKSQLEAATEAGAVGTWEWHIPEDEFVTGASFARTFGVDPKAAREGVSLDRFVSAIHEADRERVERKIEAAVETCGEYEAEYRVRNADGEFRWVVARGHVECDDEGNPVKFPGAVADITQRKRAERELEEHRKQLETLFEVLPVGVMVADDDGHIIEANEAAKEFWGVDEFDAATVADYERYPGWWADTGRRVDSEEWTLARVLRGEEVTEPDVYEIETTDGKRRTIMAHGMPIREASGEVTRGVATLTDVTERREYQRQLAESERRYRTLAENFPNGAVGVYDPDLRYTLMQGAVLGDELPARDELEGRRMPKVLPADTAADLEPVFRAAVEDGETGSTTTEFGGRNWRVWATPLRDADGDVFAGLSFAQDITEQVERERRLERTVEKLEDSNERLESFASMLAHELRNPVTIGQIYSQQLPADADAEAVEYVAEAFDRIEDMIDVMLVLTRGREAVGESDPLSLADAAWDAWDGVDAPDATLEVEADGVMEADETYVRHLFRNLFENAVQHGGRDVTVRVGDLPAVSDADGGSEGEHGESGVSSERCEDEARREAKRTGGGFYVADDGVGIPPDDRDAVFEAGFTTAASEGGTGLGLAFVEELANVYDWDYAVTESESGGARFEFTNVELVSVE